jgi:hypothetical protein
MTTIKNPLTAESARKLATRVAKESNGVSVKIGQTNGHPVLHLVNRNMPSKFAARNVTSEADWDEHPWNRQNAPRQKERKQIEGLAEAVANKEAQ